VRTLSIGGEVLTVALDATGTRLAAAGTLGRVQVFDLASGAPGRQLTVDSGWVHQIAFNPTSGVLAIGVETNPGVDPPIGVIGGYAMTWDPDTGKEVGRRIVEGQGGFPEALAWSRDGSLLVLADASHLLRFYDGSPSTGSGARTSTARTPPSCRSPCPLTAAGSRRGPRPGSSASGRWPPTARSVPRSRATRGG